MQQIDRSRWHTGTSLKENMHENQVVGGYLMALGRFHTAHRCATCAKGVIDAQAVPMTQT
jgi:hypothetical protein